MEFARKNYIILFVFLRAFCFAQPTNYVSNGSFEKLVNCSDIDPQALNWSPLDSTNSGWTDARPICKCNGKVPNSPYAYQWPRSGENYFISTFLGEPPAASYGTRRYLRNRLKAQLVPGEVYCVRFFINITNYSPYAIDKFEAYFGGSILDNISYSTSVNPLTFLNPQIKNPAGNFISDTLDWIPVSGTFTATGDEKYMLIGNFQTTASTGTLLLNPSQASVVVADVHVDDVSCIPLNVPASAGPNRSCIPGDSAFIGRQPDVGIDEACTWYQLPNMSTPIATVAGLYVKPVQTTTYIVRQQLWCSGVKWDTVVVYKDQVGLTKHLILQNVSMVPNPSSNVVTIKCPGYQDQATIEIILFDALGNEIKALKLSPNDHEFSIDISELPVGVYQASLAAGEATVFRKLVISR